jgi:DNA invertase Pin-like site-specific DNA recombinase
MGSVVAARGCKHPPRTAIEGNLFGDPMSRARNMQRSASDDAYRVAAGYIRVSTTSQSESGASLSDQSEAIRAECERRGWKLSRVWSDNAASGRSIDRRPELQEALDALDAGEASVLVTAKLDRLSRSVLDFASLMARAEREGWAIVVLDVNVDTSTPSGEMMAHVVASFAQYERRLISERTRRALAVKKAEGVQLGRPRSIPDEVRLRIATLRSAGLTLKAIADSLNADDVPRGQNGIKWWPSTIQYVLEAAS